MDLYARTPLISIYWLDDILAGYGVWSGLPHLEPMKEALAKAEGLLLGQRSHRWISNTEEALVSSPETQEYVGRWLERMGREGALRAWADIPPRSATARLVVKNLGARSGRHSIAFRQFASLREARMWIGGK